MNAREVQFLQKRYEKVEHLIQEARVDSLTERIAMQIDYLKTQLKFATGEIASAVKIARQGLTKAEKLGAKEDQSRFLLLLQEKQ